MVGIRTMDSRWVFVDGNIYWDGEVYMARDVSALFKKFVNDIANERARYRRFEDEQLSKLRR